MTQVNQELAKLLEPYKHGWLALNVDETQILAHTNTFTEINDKIKDHDPGEVVLFPLGNTQTYFVG
jgi:hypothetical protein